MIWDLESQFDTIHEQNGEIRINCPFCQDDEGFHLYINPEKGVYHCFKCDKKGSFKQFLREFKILAVQETHKEFVHSSVADRLAGKKPEDSIVQIQLDDFKPIGINYEFINNPFYRYVSERGVRVEDIPFYNLRYCYKGKYRYRVIFPAYEKGEFVYFTARTILDKPDLKRYLNPPKGLTKFTRAETVFNIDSIDANTSCVIMEGVLNAIICGRNAVACYGKFVTDYQLSKLVEKKCKEYIVALDSDAEKEALKLAKKLINHNKYVRFARFSKQTDAADIGRAETLAVLEQAIHLNHSNIDMELIRRQI